MTVDVILAILVCAIGGIGTWLLLPHRHGATRPRVVHLSGLLLVIMAFLLLARFWAPPSAFLSGLFFYAFSLVALICGVLMITSTNPVHSALWFASVVLATTGLLLLLGAQFLAAATVIIYAGAIIVTFLFVIMLAQASGQALYDRTARAPARATLCCFVLLWALLYAILGVQRPDGQPPATAFEASSRLYTPDRLGPILDRTGKQLLADSLPATVRLPKPLPIQPAGIPAPHVAGLGGTLFSDHLVAVEIAGVLLFLALIAAAAIAAPRTPPSRGRQNQPSPAPSSVITR